MDTKQFMRDVMHLQEVQDREWEPAWAEAVRGRLRRGLDHYGPEHHREQERAEWLREIWEELADAYVMATGLTASRGEEVNERIAVLVATALNIIAEEMIAEVTGCAADDVSQNVMDQDSLLRGTN